MANGKRIEGLDDEGNVLPCRGELTGKRCGEPLNEDGSCSACRTRFCQVCLLVTLGPCGCAERAVA